MQLGMIGLGRMGANMVRRLMKAGHQCVVFDLNPANVTSLASEGAVGPRAARCSTSRSATATSRRRARRSGPRPSAAGSRCCWRRTGWRGGG